MEGTNQNLAEAEESVVLSHNWKANNASLIPLSHFLTNTHLCSPKIKESEIGRRVNDIDEHVRIQAAHSAYKVDNLAAMLRKRRKRRLYSLAKIREKATPMKPKKGAVGVHSGYSDIVES